MHATAREELTDIRNGREENPAMKIEDQLCDLEFAKALSDLGMAQDAHFSWGRMSELEEYTVKSTDAWLLVLDPDIYSAFSSAELGERLPATIAVPPGKEQLVFVCGKPLDEWRCTYRNVKIGKPIESQDLKEANARAKMLIFLMKRGFIN